MGIVVVTGTRQELNVSYDDPYFWPFALEYGHGSVMGRPYLRPALENNRALCIDIIRNHIAKILNMPMGGAMPVGEGAP